MKALIINKDKARLEPGFTDCRPEVRHATFSKPCFSRVLAAAADLQNQASNKVNSLNEYGLTSVT